MSLPGLAVGMLGCRVRWTTSERRVYSVAYHRLIKLRLGRPLSRGVDGAASENSSGGSGRFDQLDFSIFLQHIEHLFVHDLIVDFNQAVALLQIL